MFFLRGVMKDFERKAKTKTYLTVIPRIAPIINLNRAKLNVILN